MKKSSIRRLRFTTASRRAPSQHQTIPLQTRHFEVALFHMAIAFDFVGDAGDLQGQGLSLGAKAKQDLFNRFKVLPDQCTFIAALFGVAKDIQESTTQKAQLGQDLEATAA